MIGSPQGRGKPPEEPEPTVPVSNEDEKINSWRYEQLTRAGFSEGEATVLSHRHDLDLHEILNLVEEQGCEPDLAYQIMA